MQKIDTLRKAGEKSNIPKKEMKYSITDEYIVLPGSTRSRRVYIYKGTKYVKCAKSSTGFLTIKKLMKKQIGGAEKTKFVFDELVNSLRLSECATDDECTEFVFINQPVLMTNRPLTKKLMCNNNDKIRKECENKVDVFYNTDKRLTLYDGVSVVFDQKIYFKVFGPNIDTILFCSALKKLFNDPKKQFASFFEIGIGSGFIAKYIKTKKPDIIGMMIDIEEQSVAFAKDELKIADKWTTTESNGFTIHTSENNIQLILGDALLYLSISNNPKCDLMVCNPPYIPSNNESSNIDPKNSQIKRNFFEGTYLMRYLINNIKKLSNKSMILIISSTSFQVEHVMVELNKTQNVKLSILLEKQVPLNVYHTNNDGKVMYIHDDKKWLEFLRIDNKIINVKGCKFFKGIKEPKDKDNPFPVHHIVYVVCLENLI